jgi:MFS transporter, YNFM family, putative membrane transport protein
LFVVAYLTIVVYCSIYGPQPLLLVLKSEFGLSEATASLMITTVLVPLGFAPLLYGYLLRTVSIRNLLVTTLSLLAVSDVGIFFSTDFRIILGLRFFQGLLIPAILTALMTHISTIYQGRDMQRAFAVYVASCIFGGFFGRIATGALSTLFGWRYSFFALCIAVIIGLVLLLRVSAAPKTDYQRLPLRDILTTLRRPLFLRICIMISTIFFVFVAISNYLPFRLAEITGGISEFRIGIAYSGYLIGMVSALFSPRIINFFGSEAKTLIAGLFCYLTATFVFLADATILIFLNMFLLCGSMGLLQTVSPGYVNKLATEHKSVANGLYISIYYTGGALGSYLPGWVYTHFGWTSYIFCLAFVVLFALALAFGLKNKTQQ